MLVAENVQECDATMLRQALCPLPKNTALFYRVLQI
jgi:hypothetical protein